MFLTIKQLAEKLRADGESLTGVERQIRCWVRDTEIPCHQGKRRGKLRFFWPEVDAWLKQRKALPTPRATVYPLRAQSKPREVIS